MYCDRLEDEKFQVSFLFICQMFSISVLYTLVESKYMFAIIVTVENVMKIYFEFLIMYSFLIENSSGNTNSDNLTSISNQATSF